METEKETYKKLVDNLNGESARTDLEKGEGMGERERERERERESSQIVSLIGARRGCMLAVTVQKRKEKKMGVQKATGRRGGLRKRW